VSNPLPPESGIPVRVVATGTAEQLGKASGEINQFVASARNVLAGIAVGTVSRQLSDNTSVKLVKNNGQERLIVVAPPGQPVSQPAVRAPATPQPRALPDYCVIDMVIDTTSRIRANFLALGVDPPTYLDAPFADEREFDFFEGMDDSYSERVGASNALMRYARYELNDAYVEIDRRTSSLLLDLRQLGSTQLVELEIWGVVRPVVSAYRPIDSRSGTGFENTETNEFFWPDGSGTPHSGDFLDPRGNPSVRFFGNPAGVELRFSNIALAGIIIEHLRPDLWDETVFDPAFIDPDSFVPVPVPAYIQRRLDPTTGAEVGYRVMVIICFFTSEILSDTLRSTRWTFDTSEKVRDGPPDDVAVARQVDVVTGFYWERPLAAYTNDSDSAGIWAVADGEVPERSKIGEGEIWNVEQPGSIEFTASSGPMTRIGVVRVDRAAQVTSFEPGS
jgi:hypothetical protein